MKKNIAVVMGGFSGEHDISIGSGTEVYKALSKEKYNVFRIIIDQNDWYYLSDEDEKTSVDKNEFSVCVGGEKINFDLAFIIVHGDPGENGRLQGYFDMIGVPYNTCGFYTSALTFNKGYCNAVVRNFGVVNLAKSQVFYADRGIEAKDVLENLELPVFVKPASGGSSVGMSKVKTEDELMPAIEKALKEDCEVLIEEFIEGREFGCGVFQTKTEKLVFPVTEIIPIGREYFDYEAKYQGFSNEITPAEVDDKVSKKIQDTASKLYDLLNCKGMVRFDFIYNEKKDMLYFLEVNTIPGQSRESIVPKQARAMGISTDTLYDMLVDTFL
jgi:D-alanine-D-alanine ligase